MLKTISEAKDNKNNKRAWLHKSYVWFGDTQKTFIAKTPKGVCLRN
jgi:hypothetical protein